MNNIGDTIYVNGTQLMFDGYKWDYPNGNYVISSGNTAYSQIIGNNSITMQGDSMASAPGLYGDILFTRQFTFQPYVAISTKTGEELGLVYEVNSTSTNGLGSTGSLYGIVGENNQMTYPLYSWSGLLDKLHGL